MESLAIAWVVFLGVSFTVSIFAVTFVQVRRVARYGWRGLGGRPFLQTYWREISLLERGLVWLGIGAFAITWLGLMTWKLASSLAQ
jgi:hypothetical protein